MIYNFQGICSAYDIIVLCKVDLLELIGLRRKPHRNGNNGNSKHQVDILLFIMNV